jgi:pimeloyl-ACP methyl ester carboxylesterase
MRPTIVLVHGAFAESSSWDQVIDRLQQEGHRAVAVGNPLRGLASDAETVTDHVRAIEGPVVLVAHSYGGAVMTNVSADAGDIVGLVYVAAFAPLPGESCFELSAVFPGSTLGDALEAIPRTDGTTELRIVPERFHAQFCADVPVARAAIMAATQRPATQEALVEPSGGSALWQHVPSWFVFGEEDRNIPKALEHHMADRAHARRKIEIPGASHAVSVAHPQTTAKAILEAAAAVPATA